MRRSRRISYLTQSYETNSGQEKGPGRRLRRRGDEVEQLVDLASVGWKSPLDRRPRSRVATRPIQFTGMEERHTPKSELLRGEQIDRDDLSGRAGQTLRWSYRWGF